ncbi:MAG TPA: aldose 1-epimerase family protein [Aggregatilineales bacterium]|nr:aldose 1-epimerase family protein [Aggregatilineales bacterium]
MELWGQHYTRRDLESYTGDLRQIADIRLSTLEDGMQRGVRIADVRTGSGFDFTVLLDRAMDIGTATYSGIPLAWQSGTGAANPARYEPAGRGWLRTFHGGLLALCGLSQAGAAADQIDPEYGDILGLHGRIGTTPAQDVSVEREWSDDGERWTMRLRGSVDEVSVFGFRLRLERTLEFTPGEPQIMIYDRVRNMGGLPAPLMVLYHCNFGWPLVAPDSEVISTSKKVTPRDDAANLGIETWNKLQPPTPGYAEQVFFHAVEPSETLQSIAILNRKIGIRMDVLFDSRSLKFVTQWKQMGYGEYVVGLEPGNCLPIGRLAARAADQLVMLAPGAVEKFTIGFRIATQ